MQCPSFCTNQAEPYNERVRTPNNRNYGTFSLLQSLKLTYGIASIEGYYPTNAAHENQDSFFVASNLLSQSDDVVFGICDGHGKYGHDCSAYVARTFPHVLANELQRLQQRQSLFSRFSMNKNNSFKNKNKDQRQLSIQEIKDALQRANLQVNQNMLLHQDIDVNVSGTTLVCIYISKRQAFVVNVGDSRAIAAQANNVAHPLTLEHTPYNKHERQRLILKGAVTLRYKHYEFLKSLPLEKRLKLKAPREIYFGSALVDSDPLRVWTPISHADENNEKQPELGVAFTRSLGDIHAKGVLGLCADASIFYFTINHSDAILVIASDGVFQFMTNQTIVEICCGFLEKKDALSAAHAIVNQARERWCLNDVRCDDISVIVVFLDCQITQQQQQQQQQVSSKDFAYKIQKERNAVEELHNFPFPAIDSILFQQSFTMKENEITVEQKITKDEYQKIIKGHILFQHLDAQLSMKIMNNISKQSTQRNQVLISSFEENQFLYFLSSGLYQEQDLSLLDLPIYTYDNTSTHFIPCIGISSLLFIHQHDNKLPSLQTPFAQEHHKVKCLQHGIVYKLHLSFVLHIFQQQLLHNKTFEALLKINHYNKSLEELEYICRRLHTNDIKKNYENENFFKNIIDNYQHS